MSDRAHVVDMVEWEAKIDRAIEKRRFTASFMSDSKWRRAFAALTQPELAIRQALWKFVDQDAPFRFAIPDATDIKNGLVGGPAGGSPFKRIEWVEITNLEIPHGWEKVPQKHRSQNVEAALGLLTETGQFETERTQSGARIYGYR